MVLEFIVGVIAVALLLAIPWGPVFWGLRLAQRHSTSRQHLATIAFDPDDGGGGARTSQGGDWSNETFDQQDDFEMYTDTDGGDGGGE